jgi:aspartyl-tRNA(Asn)/glutamyl-tRNA(Gln) amidotransferase subunit A
MPTVTRLADDLAAGRVTSEQLVEECLDRIADPRGEGERVYVAVDADQARASARAIDALREAGVAPTPYAGIPVSIKDLFDMRGHVTRAGSRVLDGAPATDDAAAVARWRRAGLIALGRTNMTEFAYSGLGINPHHGTPANPWNREARLIPGGSSSGAAVSVSDGMAHGALGSDTGGSCRIPAALCGLVGYKPTQAAVPRQGMVPLSTTLDAVGVIGRSVNCCAVLYGLLGARSAASAQVPERPPRVAVVRSYFCADIESVVAAAFERSLRSIADAGGDLVEVEVPELDTLAEMNAGGGFPAAESYAWHRELISERGSEYDPRVLVRIGRGEQLTAADLIGLQQQRTALIAAVSRRLGGFDAFVAPTVPLVAPTQRSLDDDAEYARVNLLMLRNPTVVNLIDGCAASVPMHREGEPPTGLMVVGFGGADETVLAVAAWIEERL